MNRTPSLQLLEERLKRLMKQGEDLKQMRADAKYTYRFRKLIVHENND